jgi:hypothetical protein
MKEASIKKGNEEIKLELMQQNDEVGGKRLYHWLADWWNWTISNRIDASQTLEKIYFLRILPKQGESDSSFGAEFVRDITVLEDKPILFPILNTMIDNGTFPTEDTHSKRILACKNENNASPIDYIRCTIDETNILDGIGKNEIRVESDQFVLDAIDPPLVLVDYPIPSGTWAAATEGFWICLKGLKPDPEPYILRIQAQGANGYYVNIVYRVRIAKNVNDEFDFRLLPKINEMINKKTITKEEAKIIAPRAFMK